MVNHLEFGTLFEGNGTMPGVFRISLQDGTVQYSVAVARLVLISLLQKVKMQLDNLTEERIIEKVTEPTDWCAPMVAVLKPSGDMRITTVLQN